MAEALVCLRDQGIDNDGGVIIVRQARGLRINNRGVGRGQGINNKSKGLETTMEATGDKHQDQGIYNDNGCVGRGRCEQILQQ